MTLADHILLQKISAGDFEATYNYIVRRTNLTPDETLELDSAEVMSVLTKITLGIADSLLLESIGNALDD